MKSSKNSTSKPSERKKRSDALPEEERKARRRESQKRWKANNKDQAARLKEYQQQKHYGISLAQRDEILRLQGYTCAICGSDSPRRAGADWATDHCHHSGRVRGILCHPCNMAIGLLQDNVVTLANAIDYLNKHGEEAE